MLNSINKVQIQIWRYFPTLIAKHLGMKYISKRVIYETPADPPPLRGAYAYFWECYCNISAKLQTATAYPNW
jgi:hypothetical protein